MSRREFTAWELAQAFAVDYIRQLWADGLYVNNRWLRAIHGHYFPVWMEWKTDLTMRDVDQQAEELVERWAEEDTSSDPVFTEKLNGETPLGGEMRLRASWKPPGGF